MSSPEAVQDLPAEVAAVQERLADAIEAYCELRRQGHDVAPFPADRELSPTAVAVAAAAMLKAYDIYSFEIAGIFNV